MNNLLLIFAFAELRVTNVILYICLVLLKWLLACQISLYLYDSVLHITKNQSPGDRAGPDPTPPTVKTLPLTPIS